MAGLRPIDAMSTLDIVVPTRVYNYKIYIYNKLIINRNLFFYKMKQINQK